MLALRAMHLEFAPGQRPLLTYAMSVARGGIPVCFPQFSDFGPLGQHGFARNMAFKVLSSARGTASLVLRSSEATRKVWPHEFELIITVRMPDVLICSN